jgi:8-oxo-dGTP pyrophosphatase MutT (NUDIX family)
VSDADLIPAATVLLLRDNNRGSDHESIEVLMVKRNSKIAFGGLWVFPGGRVDDHELVGNDAETAALLAAVREAEEETDLRIVVEDLVQWSHWVPPAAADIPTGQGPKRRFATWFFAARAPEGTVTIDGGEIHDHDWLEPSAALEKRDTGEIELVPPTWVTLYQLANHSTVESALQWARETESERFTTRGIMDVKPRIVLWEGDAGYETGAANVAGGRHRLTLDPAGWHYERQ